MMINSQPELKPLPFGRSLSYFFGPTLLGVLGLYVLLPLLARAGVPLLFNYLISVISMFPFLLALALIAYRWEGHPWTWRAIRTRFRIFPLDRRAWSWTAGLLVVYVSGHLLLLPTASWLADTLPLPIPAGLPPAIDPRVAKTAIPTDFIGVPLAGNWGVGLLYLGILVFNIIGEELWWRGYILPRQELAHGRWTWLVHGLLWNLFHLPFWWNQLALLPSTLSLAFVTSRLKNSTPGLIAHLVLNGLGFIMILLGILKVGA